MTVASTTTSVSYTATAGQTVFTVPFKFLQNTDLVVAQGLNTLSLGAGYTVSGAGVDPPGSVTLTVGAATNDVIVITRVMPVLQNLSLQSQGPFSPVAIEQALDSNVLLMQQVAGGFATLSGNISTIQAGLTADAARLAVDEVRLTTAEGSLNALTGGDFSGIYRDAQLNAMMTLLPTVTPDMVFNACVTGLPATANDPSPMNLLYGGGFLAPGGLLATSDFSGANGWTERTSSLAAVNAVYAVASNGTILVAAASTAQMASSTDGINWTHRNVTGGAFGYIYGIAWVPSLSLFIAAVSVNTEPAPSSSSFVTSADGINWA